MIIELTECDVVACREAGDTKHRWDYEGVSVHEMLRVQELLGIEPADWEDALNEGADRMSSAYLKAAIGLVNVLHRRIGRVLTYEETDFNIYRLGFVRDSVDLPEPEGKETPTSPLPGGDDDSTSGPEPAAASAPKSRRTRQTSGDTSD